MAEAASTPIAPTTPTAPAQTSGENSPQASQPQSTKPAEAGTKAASPEIFEIPVNGRPVKMTRQEMIDYASMGRASNDKFNEAKRIRQEAERQRELAKKDFMAFVQDPSLGLTKDQIRARIEEWYSKEFIEPESLSPAERKLREAEARLAKYEEQERLRTEESAKAQESKLTAQHREHLQAQIIETLEKSNLPKTKETVQKLAFYMRKNLLNGWDAPMDVIVRQIKEERQGSFKEEFKDISPEQFIELAGEEFVNKIRQHDLKRLREKRQLPFPSTGIRGAGTGPMGEEKISSSEVNRRLRDIRLGKI